MTADPTREQRYPDTPGPALARRLSPLVFVSGGLMGGSTLFAVFTLSIGAPWPVPALGAAGAIAAAIGLSFSLNRSLHPLCRDVYVLHGEPAFVCRGPLGHRGDHREGSIAWGRETGLLYEWSGPGGWRR